MKRVLIATFFFSIAVFSFGNEIVAKQEKTILVLFSLVPSTPAYRVLLDGIRQELNKDLGDKYTLHVENLETERYPKGVYPKERFDT